MWGGGGGGVMAVVWWMYGGCVVVDVWLCGGDGDDTKCIAGFFFYSPAVYVQINHTHSCHHPTSTFFYHIAVHPPLPAVVAGACHLTCSILHLL